MAIQLVPSDCSMSPPSGSIAPRSKTPILSRPRNPPSKMLLPPASLRLTHHVKLSRSLWKMDSRNWRSPLPPLIFSSYLNTCHAANAFTGGFTSLKDHSQAGSCPLGCMYHSLVSNISCVFANSGSIKANVTQWNARSHEAYHGNSHLSGMLMMSELLRCSHS